VSEYPVSDTISAKLAPLFQWQKTDGFARQVKRLDEYASDDLLTGGRWKPLREALILRDFAITLGYAECKLCPEKQQFPDAMLRSSGVELQVEITEVLTPGRKRDKEYREFKKNPARKAVSMNGMRSKKQVRIGWIGPPLRSRRS
jgi:hypothetical protein